MRAVSGSGSSIMSDSWMDWKPRTDEPSNARPSSNTLSSNAEAGIEKCWTTPGRSQNRMSTYSTSSSVMNFSTSSEFLNTLVDSLAMEYGWPSRATVCGRCCPSVTPMFRQC